MMLLEINWYKVFYWVTVSNGVRSFFDRFSDIFTWFSVITFVVYCILIGIRIDQADKADAEDKASLNFWVKRFGRFFWISLSLCMITWLGYMLTPTKKDALVIIAGGAVGNFIVSDSSAKQLPAEFTLLIREKMKSEIEELRTPKVSEVTDTLVGKTKEELIELLKQKK